MYYYRDLKARIKKEIIGDNTHLISEFQYGGETQGHITLFLKESSILEYTPDEIYEMKKNLYHRLLSGKLDVNMIRQHFLNHIIMEYTSKGQRIIYSGEFTFENSAFTMENGSCFYMSNKWNDDYVNIVRINNGGFGNNWHKIPTDYFFNLLDCIQKKNTENLSKHQLSEPNIC
tara:strand:+ start:1261 stop:1782 length:522 start_codon:yes stop_codon:yes gene_type:complete